MDSGVHKPTSIYESFHTMSMTSRKLRRMISLRRPRIKALFFISIFQALTNFLQLLSQFGLTKSRLHHLLPSQNTQSEILHVMQLPAICVLAATVLATNAAITFDPFSPNIFSIIPSQAEPPQCFWSGTSPFCAGSCPEGYTDTATSSCGDGACCWTGYKKYCCKN